MDDFSDLLYCFNLLIVAYGSLGNTCAVKYYLKEIDPNGYILPEEIKDIEFDIEMNIEQLESFTNNWQGQAMDEIDGEIELGSKYVIWKLKLKRAKDDFKKVLN